MKIIDPRTGAETMLWPTSALTEELNGHPSTICSHERTKIRKYIYADRSEHFLEQCLHCGTRVGKSIAKSKINPEAELEDPSIRERYEDARRESLDDIYQRHLVIQQANGVRFSEKYREHLNSAKWSAIRAKVMQRAKQTCEGCLEEPAVQVHHLTYQHLGCEFLFELVAVCKACHSRLHGGNPLLEDPVVFRTCDGCCYQGLEGDIYRCHKFECTAAHALSNESMCGASRKGYEEIE